MKLETYLNAVFQAHEACVALHWDISSNFAMKRYRQLAAFRARILWMFKELEEEIEYLVEYGNR